MNNSAELLFEYLRSILYDRPIKKLNIDCIEPELRDLAEGLVYTADCVETLTEYSKAISTGDLSVDFPKEYNELCLNIKNLHANLNHLTWQAKRVAEGDYAQHVSYLGEFSIAFNKMIEQLSEREALMKREASNAEIRAKLMQNYNDLLLKLTKHRHERIMVVSCDTKKIMYCNNADFPKDQYTDLNSGCSVCPYKLAIREKIIEHEAQDEDIAWEVEDETSGLWYGIHTFRIEWEGIQAQVHIIEDITLNKLKEESLTDMAYRDTLTGLFNRRYLVKALDDAVMGKAGFSFAFIDIDGLKYVNDTYGHQEGDKFIIILARSISNLFRTNDIMARMGGDEFGILLRGCTSQVVYDKLERKYKELYSKGVKPYKLSFSYGAIDVAPGEGVSAEELIKRADDIMYECKMKHKGTYQSGRY